MDELTPSDDLTLKYIDDELSQKERTAFENRLSKDPSLKSRVEELLLARDAVRHYGTRESVASVRKSWEASKTQPGAKIVPMRKWLRYGAVAVAASIILIVSMLTLVSGPSSDKIYIDVYVGYTLSNSRGEQTSLTPVEQAYQAKDFAGVIRLTEKKPLSGREQLLLGIAYLETNNLTSSIHMLKGLQEQTNIPYHSDADFYLALAHLKNKEYNDAIGLFQKIQFDSAHPYHRQVNADLIAEIRKLKD